MWIRKGQNGCQVGGICAGLLGKKTSSSVHAAHDKSTMELDIGCSLWLETFIRSRCFRVTLGIHMMKISPWVGTISLFKTVNPRQAQARRTHRFKANPWMSPLCFPHEDKEEQREMNPAWFLIAVIGITCAKSVMKF